MENKIYSDENLYKITEEHRKTLDIAIRIFKEKNRFYNGEFLKVPIEQNFADITRKYNRLNSILNNGGDRSQLNDTLLDLINYAAMIYIRENGNVNGISQL